MTTAYRGSSKTMQKLLFVVYDDRDLPIFTQEFDSQEVFETQPVQYDSSDKSFIVGHARFGALDTHKDVMVSKVECSAVPKPLVFDPPQCIAACDTLTVNIRKIWTFENSQMT